MTNVCNIWMICLELNWLFYDPSWMLQLSEFVWSLRSSAWVVFNNFLRIDATDRNKISSDQKRSFFANTPFNILIDIFNRILNYMAWMWYLTQLYYVYCIAPIDHIFHMLIYINNQYIDTFFFIKLNMFTFQLIKVSIGLQTKNRLILYKLSL